MNSYPFIKGLELSGYFYQEAVRPLLDEHFPGLPHSAARLDYGSDVLGFDNPQSMDHGWGCRLLLYVREEEYSTLQSSIREMLRQHLPPTFRGIPTGFDHNRLVDGGQLVVARPGEIEHGVDVTTPRRFFREYAGLETTPGVVIRLQEWLVLPQQRLRTIRSGRVYYDGLGELEPVRRALDWYPHDLWLYLMANQWRRISQEEPFMGRCGDTGDELGSRLVEARLVHDIMGLCFLMENQYAPYSKWFGTAFKLLACAAELQPLLMRVWEGKDWRVRQEALSASYEVVMRMHNALKVTEPLEVKIAPFYTRPYRVPDAGRYVAALLAAVQDPEVRALPEKLGSVDQVVRSIDVLENTEYCLQLKALYR